MLALDSVLISFFFYLPISIVIYDEKDVKHTVYIDPWFENPKCPESEKDPEACDLVLVTHGHFDHVGGAMPLLAKFKEAKCVCIFEVGEYLKGKGADEE